MPYGAAFTGGAAFSTANVDGGMVVVTVSPCVIGPGSTGDAAGGKSAVVFSPVAIDSPVIVTKAAPPSAAKASLVRRAAVS